MTDLEFRTDVTVQLYKTDASDLDVARAAWVSSKGDDAKEAESGRLEGLINYLTKARHGSCFEHNSFTFAIDAPIFVVREFMRHRAGWSYNEFSGRYSEMKPVFYAPGQDRLMVQEGKPGHPTFTKGTDTQFYEATEVICQTAGFAWQAYEDMISEGIAKEVARMCLPVNIFSSFFATCNARSLMHFLSLRTENETAVFPSHPQYEIQLVADKMEAIFKQAMPLTWAAWDKNGRVAP